MSTKRGVRSKTQKRRLVVFFTGLSNQRQLNWVKAFLQTPTDSKSTGVRFVDKAGCPETSEPENSVENSLQVKLRLKSFEWLEVSGSDFSGTEV